MSAPASPRRIAKKQSLSILSSSTLNQINNQQNDFTKPAKERIISESTGLIKFSLKKTPPEETENGKQESKEAPSTNDFSTLEDQTAATDVTSEKENLSEQTFSKMPIYIPINNDEQSKSNDDSQELLFKLASQQRKVLDLTEQLKQAKEELNQLEKMYQTSALGSIFSKTNSVTKVVQSETLSSNMIPSPIKVASTLRKSASRININTPKINAQEQITKTQKQVADTFNQLTANISNNNFLLRSRTFFETNLNKNIQIGSELFNSIFEKDDNAEIESDTEVLVDEDTHNFDYSVDFDLDRLNKLNFSKKIRGTILENLEEVEPVASEKESNINDKLVRTITSISNNSEEDYGGEVTNL